MRPRGLCFPWVLALAVVVPGGGGGALVFGQDLDEPVVFTEKRELGGFGLTNVHGTLVLYSRTQSDDNTSASGTDTKSTEQIFRESLELASEGFIVHPNLVSLNLFGSLGISQQTFETDGETNRERGQFNEFDISALILRREVAPLTLYARRSQKLLTRQFSGSLDSVITTYGAAWDIRSHVVPTQLQLYRTEQDQTGLTGQRDFTFDQNTFEWQSVYKPTAYQTWSWNYAFNQVNETTGEAGSEAFQFDSHEASLSHVVNFAEDHQDQLLSSLNIFRQSGDFELGRTDWRESLRLKHSDTLRSFYDYSLGIEKNNSFDQTQQRAEAGLRHQLFESLFTTARVGGNLLNQSNGFESRESYASVDTDYRKNVPGGLVSANLGVSYNRQDNSERSEVATITDESHTFSDPNPVVLNGNNIIPGSIVVTDPSGLVVFSPAFDYTVTALANRVEVRRIIGGAIANGTAVLIDYSLSPQQKNVTNTTGLGFGARYDVTEGALKGVGVYARYFQQDQDIQADVVEDFSLDQIRDYVFGADYRVWKITTNAEYQKHDSTIAPFIATRFSGRISDRFENGGAWGLAVDQSSIEYPDENNLTTFLTISGNYERQFSRRWWTHVRLAWRDENDQLRGSTKAFEQQVELRWQHRQTNISMLFRNAMLDTLGQESTTRLLEVRLRREF